MIVPSVLAASLCSLIAFDNDILEDLFQGFHLLLIPIELALLCAVVLPDRVVESRLVQAHSCWPAQ